MLVYMSVERTQHDKIRNKAIQKEILKKIQENQDTEKEALILLGDMNGHTGLLGEQSLDNNGKFILQLITEANLILLNDDRCTGMYTWSQEPRKSVIDYVLVNNEMYTYYESMHIDERQEITDLSDHNLITVNLNIGGGNESYGNKAEWKTTEYYRTDEESLKKYTLALETQILNKNISNITDFNKLVKEVADSSLKKKYKRKTKQDQKLHEPPWMTHEIRTNIKKRKEYNRKKRNAVSEEERNHWRNLFVLPLL